MRVHQKALHTWWSCQFSRRLGTFTSWRAASYAQAWYRPRVRLGGMGTTLPCAWSPLGGAWPTLPWVDCHPPIFEQLVLMLNGEPSPPVWRRKGLRQGDLLSSTIFVLVEWQVHAPSCKKRMLYFEILKTRPLHPTKKPSNIWWWLFS